MGKNIIIVRPPGAGKNTQCDFIIKKFGVIHFGAGDLLRAEVSFYIYYTLSLKKILKKDNLLETLLKKEK